MPLGMHMLFYDSLPRCCSLHFPVRGSIIVLLATLGEASLGIEMFFPLQYPQLIYNEVREQEREKRCGIMQMENINENTIRVLIENADLEERGITFLDLLGNQKQIENFFYSILEEVDVDNQFHETDAITFQVLPNANGLELFISKGHQNDDGFDAFEGSESLEEIMDYVQNQKESNPSSKTQEDTTLEDAPLEIMLKFQSFEDFIELSKRLFLESGLATLYHYEGNYYLAIVFFVDEMLERNLEDEIAIALEFAEEADIATEVLGEYGKVIMSEDALDTARRYFK